MRYQKLETQIWIDEKFILLSERAKLLFLYVLSSPHSNALGVYVLPSGYICADLQWTSEQLLEPFQELLEQGFILYDKKVRLVLIVNHLKHNPLANENQTIAAIKILNQLPKSPLFIVLEKHLDKPFHKRLREQLKQRLREPYSESESVTEEKEINTNPSSKLPSLPSTKSRSERSKEKNGLVQERISKARNYYESLKPNAKTEFYLNAVSLRKDGLPIPDKGSETESELFVEYYECFCESHASKKKQRKIEVKK